MQSPLHHGFAAPAVRMLGTKCPPTCLLAATTCHSRVGDPVMQPGFALCVADQILHALPSHDSPAAQPGSALHRCPICNQTLSALPTHSSSTDCRVSYICHKHASRLLQVSSFGSGALHPMWLRSSCKAACTAKPSRCHLATVSSKTSSHLLLSMLPRLLPADHQLPDASQVPDLTCSCHMYSPMHHVCMVPVIEQLV